MLNSHELTAKNKTEHVNYDAISCAFDVSWLKQWRESIRIKQHYFFVFIFFSPFNSSFRTGIFSTFSSGRIFTKVWFKACTYLIEGLPIWVLWWIFDMRRKVWREDLYVEIGCNPWVGLFWSCEIVKRNTIDSSSDCTSLRFLLDGHLNGKPFQFYNDKGCNLVGKRRDPKWIW